jgi:prepilin-type N-terminal cleavage/methylation domain-containing protein
MLTATVGLAEKTTDRGLTMKSRPGFSLVELTVVLMLILALTALAAPRMIEARDHNDMISVKRQIVAHFHAARSSAVQRGRQVSVHIEADSIWVAVVTAAGDSAITTKRSLAATGTDVESSQTQVIYDSRGFAVGLPLSGGKVRIHGITASDSVCVTRSGMVLQRGCV